jgi:PhnB protein
MKRKAKSRVKKVSYLPKGYSEVTPYMSIRGAAKAIDFYKKAFGAKEVMRMPGPAGKLGHAEIAIGAARIMLADEHPEIDFLGPESRGGSAVHLHVYVKNVDAISARAVAAGAELIRPVEDQFYGDRSGSLKDPFGHVWHFATHKRDVSKAEMRKAAAQRAKEAAA